MMAIFGIDVSQWFGRLFQQHKMLQMDGFLTLLIMGIGYMIVPRFRNISLPSVKFAYLSYFLVVSSLIFQLVILQQTVVVVVVEYNNNSNFSIWIIIIIITLRLSGLIVFTIIVFLTLRVKPKLLRVSDYFIVLSVITLLIVNVIELLPLSGYIYSNTNTTTRATNPLTYTELWLLFPIIMILGIEYKTLPSFLGFIRPRKMAGIASFILASSCVTIGLASSIMLPADFLILHLVFNIILLISAATFATSIYAFGGFDNTEILRVIQGEKKARYNFTVIHIKTSFLFLFIGITMAILFNLISFEQEQKQYQFIFYDLAIHSIAIGFIGITIALYLPLMLPPIIGKIIQFTNFNKIPLLLIILSLSIRAFGDFVLTRGSPLSYYSSSLRQQDTWIFMLPELLKYSLGLSGWLVVAAMFVFVVMIHKSMKELKTIETRRGRDNV
jgi:hypothetical protein